MQRTVPLKIDLSSATASERSIPLSVKTYPNRLLEKELSEGRPSISSAAATTLDVVDLVGEDHFCVNIDDAIAFARQLLDEEEAAKA
ncbi:hypothetical protein [Raoultibacter phocaeensis]|uniref:hypothetical protein n=1 Tax=Raoultibacter phocaeensis TaxID=2479841 RepID=UPI001118D9F7|nr:hypothetical protein [Raoultibacter phocaeensis]